MFFSVYAIREIISLKFVKIFLIRYIFLKLETLSMQDFRNDFTQTVSSVLYQIKNVWNRDCCCFNLLAFVEYFQLCEVEFFGKHEGEFAPLSVPIFVTTMIINTPCDILSLRAVISHSRFN